MLSVRPSVCLLTPILHDAISLLSAEQTRAGKSLGFL